MARALAQGLGSAVFSKGLCEPFVGGASLFFATRPKEALLGDINQPLITTYETLRDNPGELAEALAKLTIDPDTFHAIRSTSPTDSVGSAARFIYLNRTAFGGLWRVNRRGEFNVPFGCKPGTRLPNEDELRQASRELSGAEFICADFRTVVHASANLTVYFDPPYASDSLARERFVRYSGRVFSWSDQVALAHLATELATSGRHILVSNSYSPDVLALYDSGPFKAYKTTRPTNFASNSSARGSVQELFLLSKSTRFRKIPPGFLPLKRRR